MNSLFLRGKRGNLFLSTLFVLPWVILLLGLVAKNPALSCLLGLGAVICSLTALAFLSSSLRRQKLSPSSQSVTPKAQQEVLSQRVSSFPTTLAEAWKMPPSDFELLAAAVILTTEEGYRFLEHCGGRGDRGVDVKLLNAYGQLVVVQCKRNAARHHVSPDKVRDLGGTVITQDAAFGYLVTTSTFTAAALQEKRSHGRIRTIDGPYLETLLQDHTWAIAQELDGIYQQIAR